MIFKIFTSIYFIFQNPSIADELAREQKSDSLMKLTTILSIALITIFILLILNLVINNRLKAENSKLKKQLNS